MYGTILAFIKFNNFGTRHLNGPRHLFYSFYCTTRRIFESLRVYEPGFNTDKYGMCSTVIKMVCTINYKKANKREFATVYSPKVSDGKFTKAFLHQTFML